ncbi:MAG: glycerophosphodiester phosphodiesterase [Chloroflexi bacterium]|nr:glycerophosphodiester phosphodiesterase [Chloroflexota bacterium]
MHQDLPIPTIFAHRGASAYAPENTLAAFILAVRQRADAIELDAKLSSDGHVVVIHDATVDRTTDGKGYVKDLPLAELKEFDAGCTYDASFCNERIPTLNEVFDIIGRQTFINIDLTNYRTASDQLPEKVAELVKYHNLSQRVLFSSFHPVTLYRIHKLLPNVPTGFLTLPGFKGSFIYALFQFWIPHQVKHQAVANTTAQLIRRTHNRKQRIYAYTVNDPNKITQLHQWGIDGIFTDDPLMARQAIEDPKMSIKKEF